MTHFRWVILAVVFVGTTLNFLDRSIMGVLATPLQEQYGITDVQYGYIQSAFAFSYGLSQSVSGGLLDRFGNRLVYAVALAGWSIAAMLHALARGAWGFGLARALLGISESPNYPAAAKIIAEWFPRRERAFAFGFINAGTNMGAILAPAAVPVLAATFGWQSAFIALGAIGLAWLCVWIPVYRSPQEHPRVSPEELAADSQRSAGTDGQSSLAGTAALSPGLGVRPGKIPDRLHVVVLHHLAAKVLE